MRISAINALMQMDDAQAVPILREVLKKRGPCSEILRRKAVFVLSQTHSPEAADILFDVARNDPDLEVRKHAVQWMHEVRSERSVALLDSILRQATESQIRDAALYALTEHRSPSARDVVRRYVQDSRTPTEGRYKAIQYIGIHSGKPEDGEFLITLYPKLTERREKQAVIHALGEIETQASWNFLLRIVLDTNESVQLRKDALFWAEQADVPTAELFKLEAKLEDRDLRKHYVWVLSERKDDAATDRLIQIAKTHQDVELRKQAIFWLGQRNDPRVRQLLLDIINQ